MTGFEVVGQQSCRGRWAEDHRDNDEPTASNAATAAMAAEPPKNNRSVLPAFQLSGIDLVKLINTKGAKRRR